MRTKVLKSLMLLGLSSLVMLGGCSNTSEEDVYGMKVEDLEKHAKEVSTKVVNEEQKKVLSSEESNKLEVGTFVDNMPNKDSLIKNGKDFVCVLYGKYPDGSETVHLEYENSYSGNIPYPREYYVTDGINGEFWCVGYIICEMKYEEKDGKTYKMVRMPEEFGSTKMYWYNAGQSD